MKPACRNDCVDKLLFPKRLKNRPGLSDIDYRIGTYSDFREALFRKLNKDATLVAWTHREPDDPGVALLEGASILGDILTFYQELYANEAYVRTAKWRESIADLVRLLGYRLSPGVGGRATFAFEVKGDKPVLIPKGFPIKAQLEDMEQPVEFENLKEFKAYPHLNQFKMYRPRIAPQSITSGIDRLEIQSANSLSDVASINEIDINAGDRIMIVPDATMYDDVNGTTDTTQMRSEIMVVKEVQKVLDRCILIFEGSLTVDRDTTVTAYRIGRTFRHFGHNAPAQLTRYVNSTKSIIQEPTNFDRDIWGTRIPTSDYMTFYPILSGNEMPLDEEVNDLAEGNKIICQGSMTFSGRTSSVDFTVVKRIISRRSDSLVWGNSNGSSTVVTINSNLIINENIVDGKSDIRKMSFHEVIGPMMTLRAPSEWNDGIFVDNILYYFGTYDDVLALVNRKLLFEKKDGKVQQIFVTSQHSDFSLTSKDKVNPWLWPVTLDWNLEDFLLEDFDEQYPLVTVYGNLVDATQGKTEKEAKLGNGDSRQTFQTFKLPKAPLTYHVSSETPPEVPELQIYVNDRLWKRVSTFFDRKPKEEIYIVREDANGDSWVQFGDGKTGARLPTGIKNVKAIYRTGTGAYGSLKEDTTVQAGGKLNKLDKIYLPGVVSGGDMPETGGKARKAAPGKIQSLGRLVGLKDFESEALAIAGVSKVSASWGLVDNIPSVEIVVLMDTGREPEFNTVKEKLTKDNMCRGPQRFPVNVEQGRLLFVYIDAEYSLDTTFRKQLVEDEIKKALGASGEEGNGIDGSQGLFGIRQRQFGQSEFATRVAGTIQNVEGVVWVKVTALGLLGEADGPSKLSLPSEPKPFDPFVSCDNLHILSLYAGHLKLSVAVEETVREC